MKPMCGFTHFAKVPATHKLKGGGPMFLYACEAHAYAYGSDWPVVENIATGEKHYN